MLVAYALSSHGTLTALVNSGGGVALHPTRSSRGSRVRCSTNYVGQKKKKKKHQGSDDPCTFECWVSPTRCSTAMEGFLCSVMCFLGHGNLKRNVTNGYDAPNKGMVIRHTRYRISSICVIISLALEHLY